MVRDEQGYLTATHVVRTPELVEFQFELAGLSSRMLAWLVDGAIALAIAFAGILALSFLSALSTGLAGFLIFIVLFLTHWAYFTGFEWRMGGQTPGKRMMGIRVVQRSGVRIEFVHAALRNLLRAFDHLPALYGVGGGAALMAPSRQRLGDRVAGTVVVRERRRKTPSGLSAHDAERSSVAISDERLRRATLAERELLLSAALRREELQMDARLTLFHELAAYLSERFGITRPDHLSDEKVVLDAVACLLRLEGAAPTTQRRGRARAS